MIYSTDPLTWAFLPGSGPQGRTQRCPRRCTSSPNKVWGAASCDHHTEAPWRPLVVPLLPSWNPSPVPLPEGHCSRKAASRWRRRCAGGPWGDSEAGVVRPHSPWRERCVSRRERGGPAADCQLLSPFARVLPSAFLLTCSAGSCAWAAA